MRLKTIEPGMVIHCKTQEEMEQLIEYYKIDEDAERIWNYKSINPNNNNKYNCLKFDKFGNYSSFSSREYFKSEGYEITEFSDLILPEMTADEVLDILSEIRNCKDRDCYECPLDSICGDNGGVCVSDKEKILQICQQWKSDHEKKEPEVEWVYRVFGAENFGEKFFRTEEEAIKRCEELAKSQKTKQYARYERICRVME